MPKAACVRNKLHLDHDTQSCDSVTRVYIDSKGSSADKSSDGGDLYELPETIERVSAVSVPELKMENAWCMLSESEREYKVKNVSTGQTHTTIIPSSVFTVVGGGGRVAMTAQLASQFNTFIGTLSTTAKATVGAYEMSSSSDGENIVFKYTGSNDCRIVDCGLARALGLNSFPFPSDSLFTNTLNSTYTAPERHQVTLPDLYMMIKFVNGGMNTKCPTTYAIDQISPSAKHVGDQCFHKVSVDGSKDRYYIHKGSDDGQTGVVQLKNFTKRVRKFSIQWAHWNGEPADLQGTRYSATIDFTHHMKTK